MLAIHFRSFIVNAPQIVPLAAGWIEFVIFLIIMGSSVIGQIIKAVQQKAEADRRRRTAESMRKVTPPTTSGRERLGNETRGKANQGKQQPKPVQAKAVSNKSKSQPKRVARPAENLGRVAPTAALGAELSLADERLESHLHHTFDHRLGQFTGTTSTIAEGTDAAYWSGSNSGSATASRIRELLSSPQDLPAVVLLGEVLRRPEERWSK